MFSLSMKLENAVFDPNSRKLIADILRDLTLKIERGPNIQEENWIEKIPIFDSTDSHDPAAKNIGQAVLSNHLS